MATTDIYYEFRRLDLPLNEGDKNLCFICATTEAIKADTDKVRITLKSAPAGTYTCDDCGSFIHDSITI